MVYKIIIALICVLPAFAQSGKRESAKELARQKELSEKVKSTQKAIWVAHVLRRKHEEQKISGLQFVSNRVPVFLLPKEDTFKPLVVLKAKFERPGWQLLLGKDTPANSSGVPGEFAIYAFLNSRISQVQFTARSPEGEVERETVYIFAPEANEFKMVSAMDSFLFRAGWANLFYEQTSFGVFNAETLLLGTSYISPERGEPWGWLFDAELTVGTLSSTPIDLNPQFYEMRFGITYALKLFDLQRTRSRMIYSISTMGLVSHGSPFGFGGLFGPSVGVRTEYFTSQSESFFGEIFLTGYDVDIVSERSIGTALTWRKNLENTRQFSLSLKYSNHNFTTAIEEVIIDYFSVSGSFSF
ncbi:MAG: hypothetical protein R2827_08550 [Bdellovibrionales bacterium]